MALTTVQKISIAVPITVALIGGAFLWLRPEPPRSIIGLKVEQHGPGIGMVVQQSGPGIGLKVTVGTESK